MKLKKSQAALLITALSLAAFAIMGDMVIIPVAEFMYTTYDAGSVSYILSAPALISAFVSAASGKIIEKIGAKKFLIVGFGIFMVSAVATVFSQELPLMLVSRTLQGVGMGTLAVCAIVVISEHFLDEKQRSSMIGIYNAFTAILGAALGMIAGVVAASGWTNVFYLYLATIPIFILLFFAVPKDPVLIVSADDEATAAQDNTMPWGIVIRVAISFFVFGLVYNIVYYQIAVIVADKGIVDTAYIGMLSALGTVGSFVASALFGAYVSKTKRFTITIGYALMAIFFTVLYFSTNEIIIAVACMMLGASWAIGLNHFYSFATMIVPPSRIPISTATITFAMGVGTFFATYVPFALMEIMGTNSITATIPLLVGVLVIACVLSIVFGVRERHYFKNM